MFNRSSNSGTQLTGEILGKIITTDLTEMRKLMTETSAAVIELVAKFNHFVVDSTRMRTEVHEIRDSQKELDKQRIPERLTALEVIVTDLANDKIARQSQWSGPMKVATMFGALTTIGGGLALIAVLVQKFI